MVRAQSAEGSEASEPAGNLDTTVSLSLNQAPVEEVFKAFAEIGSWKLVVESTTVSVELDDTPIREALDKVCAQVNCNCSLELAANPVLRINWID